MRGLAWLPKCATRSKSRFAHERGRLHKQCESAYFTVKFTVYVATLRLIWSSTVSLSVWGPMPIR